MGFQFPLLPPLPLEASPLSPAAAKEGLVAAPSDLSAPTEAGGCVCRFSSPVAAAAAGKDIRRAQEPLWRAPGRVGGAKARAGN